MHTLWPTSLVPETLLGASMRPASLRLPPETEPLPEAADDVSERQEDEQRARTIHRPNKAATTKV